MINRLGILLLLCLGLAGCTVVSANRTFPKLDWCWSRDAQMQRDYNHLEKAQRYLSEQIARRDSEIVDLAFVGQSMVERFGKDLAWKTVTTEWAYATGGISTDRAGDVIWLQDQPSRVQSLAWMVHWKSDWVSK